MSITTTDIYESAYMLCCGGHLSDVWVNKGRQRKTVVFEFDGQNIKDCQRHYHTGEAEVNIIDFRRHLDHLRDQITQVRNQNTNSRNSKNAKETIRL